MTEMFATHRRLIDSTSALRVSGRVVEITGLSVIAEGLLLPIGSVCRIDRTHDAPVPAQVVSAQGDRTLLMTLGEPLGLRIGDPVTSTAGLQHVPVGRQMLGAVLDGLGVPVGGRRSFTVEAHYPVYADPPSPLSRRPIEKPLATGIRAIDAMLTIGGGQRMGIFAGTGVGKSVLLGMIARNTKADVIVAALVGERGREVQEFLKKDLGEEGLTRSVLVVSTSDESPVLRVRAGFVATAVAEYFRDLGHDVLLLADSITRMAMAQRQIGLSAGEPPTTKGYPPSVFSLLPRLLERSGRAKSGSITGLYSVLVEGDDLNEPISDAARSILDGHIWLSRDLANRGHYPAISVLESVSRVMNDVVSPEQRAAAAALRRTIAVWNDIADLVNIGAYAKGANVEFDIAVAMKPAIDEFLQQAVGDRADFEKSSERLLTLAGQIGRLREQLSSQPIATVFKKAS
jgi:flagellum-specific ATP synthase